MMKTKILFVMPSLGSGGAEKSFVSMLPLLSHDEFEIHVMVVKEEGLFYPLLPKQDITYVDAPKNLKIALGSIHSEYLKSDCSTLDRIRKNLSNIAIRFHGIARLGLLQFTWEIWKRIIPQLTETYDVAVSFMDGMTNFYVIDKIEAKKKILWVHNDYNKIKTNKDYEHPYFAKADYVATISNLCVKSLKETFPDLKDKFIAIENISSKKLIDKMADEFYPEEYKGIEGKTIILSIGRLVEQKGFDLAVRAAKTLKEKGFHFKWFIIGVGRLKENLKAYISQNDLQNYFELLGERPNPYPYIKHCNLFLQTSRFEGKSIVVDEAKILNKPIIATNYPTVKDNIQDGQNGIICEISPEAIANAIIALNQDESKQRHIISHLKKYCNGNEDEVEKYIKLFCRTHNQKVLSI